MRRTSRRSASHSYGHTKQRPEGLADSRQAQGLEALLVGVNTVTLNRVRARGSLRRAAPNIPGNLFPERQS